MGIEHSDDYPLLQRLSELYPNPRSELDFRNEFELVVAVLLSAQCTDRKVNQVTPVLFGRFADFRALASASEDEVAQIIRPINYYRTKAKHLVGLGQKVLSDFQGVLPRDHTALTSLPGVGRKTANVVLGELGVEPRLAVDTHVFRVARRLGLTRGKTPLKVEESLTKRFPPETWRMLHHGLILHGRRVCKAQRPACEGCGLKEQCAYGKRR